MWEPAEVTGIKGTVIQEETSLIEPRSSDALYSKTNLDHKLETSSLTPLQSFCAVRYVLGSALKGQDLITVDMENLKIKVQTTGAQKTMMLFENTENDIAMFRAAWKVVFAILLPL